MEDKLPDVYQVILRKGFTRSWFEYYLAEYDLMLALDHFDDNSDEEETQVFSVCEIPKRVHGQSVPEIVECLAASVHQLQQEVNRIARLLRSKEGE